MMASCSFIPKSFYVQQQAILQAGIVDAQGVYWGAGVTDVDPPFAWNCQVVAGAGVVEDVQQLYSDMHSYLAG